MTDLARRHEDALYERVAQIIESARTQVTVRRLSGDGWFGTWEARSTGLYGKSAPARRVQVRSLSERSNHCDCPDFATNRLGTCKHVEAVLHRLQKRAPKKFARLQRQGSPLPLVVVRWSGEALPTVELTGRLPAGATRRPMGDWLQVAFDQSRSPSFMSELINEAGRRAGEILDQIDFSPLGRGHSGPR